MTTLSAFSEKRIFFLFIIISLAILLTNCGINSERVERRSSTSSNDNSNNDANPIAEKAFDDVLVLGRP